MIGEEGTKDAEVTKETKVAEIRGVLTKLKRTFPNPGAMEIGDPFRTLCAVMLSARTRDEQVLKLLPGFFRAFPTSKELARATTKQIEARINTIGMYRQKARHLSGMAKIVAERAQRVQKAQRAKESEIPDTMEGLVALPGVGRKTASVVLVVCFNKPAIAVDTHVHRVTNRLGWVHTKTPEKTEQALLQMIPADIQRTVNQVFVKFGRYICIPGRPRCWMCPVREHCAYKNKNLVAPKDADAIRADIERREKKLEQLRRSV